MEAEKYPPLRDDEVLYKGTHSFELYKDVPQPKEGDFHIVKHKYDAFHGTDLDTLLRNTGRDTIIITGVTVTDSFLALLEEEERMLADQGAARVLRRLALQILGVRYFGYAGQGCRLHLYRLEALGNDEAAVQGAESVRRWREAGSDGNHPNSQIKKKTGCFHTLVGFE